MSSSTRLSWRAPRWRSVTPNLGTPNAPARPPRPDVRMRAAPIGREAGITAYGSKTVHYCGAGHEAICGSGRICQHQVRLRAGLDRVCRNCRSIPTNG